MKSNPNNDGRYCAVRDIKTGNTIVEAFIVDSTTKRVRLAMGEHFGESREAGEYELLELRDVGESPTTEPPSHRAKRPLAEALAEANEP